MKKITFSPSKRAAHSPVATGVNPWITDEMIFSSPRQGAALPVVSPLPGLELNIGVTRSPRVYTRGYPCLPTRKQNHYLPVFVLSLLLLTLASACFETPDTGREGAPCFSKGWCFDNLVCSPEKICVKPGTSDGGDAGTDAGADSSYLTDGAHDAADGGYDSGSDGGPDAGMDGGWDAGDIGVDGGVDAGIDGGLDSGLDASLDAGTDSGVDDAGVAVTSISPDEPYVSTTKTVQFSAIVKGTANPTIDWTASTGSIDITGKFTAPASPEDVTITAWSHVDPSKFKSTIAHVVALPSITSFTAAKTALDYGESTTLTAVFSDGTGEVDIGVGAVTTGIAKAIGPLASTTTYTLTVTNSIGDSVTADVTVNVNQVVVSDIAPSEPLLSPNQIQQFSATVTGAVDKTVDWTAGAGTIDTTGNFTAPSTTGGVTITAKSHAEPTKFKTTTAYIIIEGEMVTVSSGDFWMGCNTAVDTECGNAEKPYHKVTLSTYKIDKYEVTISDYKKCVDASSCTAARTSSGCNYAVPGKESHPITCVDWNQATAYCQWTGKRLPTEAEWEKAARGTNGQKYPWGSTGLDCDHAVMSITPCSYSDTAPVGSKSAGVSPCGAMDMIGNAEEWVADWFDENYYNTSPTNDPQGPADGSCRVLRGGSRANSVTSALRASARGCTVIANWDISLGFRCAWSSGGFVDGGSDGGTDGGGGGD